jgi:hypothetical protein
VRAELTMCAYSTGLSARLSDTRPYQNILFVRSIMCALSLIVHHNAYGLADLMKTARCDGSTARLG